MRISVSRKGAPFAIALAGIIALAAWASPAEADSPPELVIAKGSDGRLASSASPGRRRAPWIEIATTDEKYAELWRAYVPGAPDDAGRKIDFKRERVVFLLLGPQPTGGYAIEPVDLKTRDGVVRIRAKLVQPMSPDDVTQAITAPYAVVVIPSDGADTVDWVGTDGRLVATSTVE